jgi:hypothetical protein
MSVYANIHILSINFVEVMQGRDEISPSAPTLFEFNEKSGPARFLAEFSPLTDESNTVRIMRRYSHHVPPLSECPFRQSVGWKIAAWLTAVYGIHTYLEPNLGALVAQSE